MRDVTICCMGCLVLLLLMTGLAYAASLPSDTFSGDEGFIVHGPFITNTSARSATVSWKTAEPVYGALLYSREENYTRSGEYDVSVSDPAVSEFHRIVLDNLEPGQMYHYTIPVGPSPSPDYHFRTFPEKGSVTFIVYGDTRDEPPLFTQADRHRLVAERIGREDNVSFVIHTGDLVYSGNETAEWKRFFSAAGEMLANNSFVPVPGNHDDNPAFSGLFGPSPWYSFDCAGVHVIVLDSTDRSWPVMDDQTAWLEKDLNRTPASQFVVVTFHHPFYSSDPRTTGSPMHEKWEDIFVRGGVDLAFNGHMHVYERYEERGIPYVVVATGGAPLYTQGNVSVNGYRNGLANTLGYVRVTVDTSNSTGSMDFVKVAEVSPDNRNITRVHPAGTLFETVPLDFDTRVTFAPPTQPAPYCDMVWIGLGIGLFITWRFRR